MQGSDVRKQLYLPYACDSGDLRKLKIKQHMFLIIHNINSSPVHRYYHVILWQTGAWKLVSFVKSREQQRPLITSVVDNILFDVLRFNLLSRVVSLLKGTHTKSNKSNLVHTWMDFPASPQCLHVFSHFPPISTHCTLSSLLFKYPHSPQPLSKYSLSPTSLNVFTLSPISLHVLKHFSTSLRVSILYPALIWTSRMHIIQERNVWNVNVNEMFCGRSR